MLLRRSCSAAWPIVRPHHRPQSTSATNPVLASWLEGLPSSTIKQQDHVSLSHVQALASTLELPGHRTTEQWQQGDALPPGWSLIFFPTCFARTSELSALDLTERTKHHPPASGGLDERMWVGGSFTFAQGAPALRVGEEITVKATVGSVKDRKGKDGRVGWYVEQKREMSPLGSAADIASVVETRTHLYRPALASPALAKPPTPAPKQPEEADFSYPFLPTPAHLIRFSALTFNTHRIHWDLDYCLREEHRPGLIVHGPLTALLLLTNFHHACTALNLRVQRFTYRATSPLVVGRPIAFKGVWKGGEAGKGACRLWVEGAEDGVVYMEGEGFAEAGAS